MHHSSAMYSKDMIVFGGVDINSGISLGDIWSLDTGLWTWSQISDGRSSMHPGPRLGHAHVHFDDTTLLVGGKQNITSDCSNDVWILDMLSLEWMHVEPAGSSPPGLCWHTASVSTQGSIVVLDPSTSNVWQLSRDSWTWSLVTQAQLPQSVRGSASLGADKLHVLSQGCRTSSSECFLWEFNFNSEVWSTKSISQPLSVFPNVTYDEVSSNPAAVSLGGNIVYTGVYETFSEILVLAIGSSTASLDVFHTSEVQLGSVTPGSLIEPQRRQKAAGAAVQSHFVIFGGTSSVPLLSSNCDVEYMRDTWVFDLVRLRWNRVEGSALSPPGRHGHSMTFVGQQIVLFGGSTFYSSLVDLISVGRSPRNSTACGSTSFND
eukprot:2051126-Rhodomonas_salina.1